MSTLQAGVFDDFKNGRTLLLWTGSAEPLQRLTTALRARADAPVVVTDLPWVRGVDRLRLKISVSEACGIEEQRLPTGETEISLRLSPSQLDQVASLESSELAGHHYLDLPGELQVVVSKGEYPPEFGRENRQA